VNAKKTKQLTSNDKLRQYAPAIREAQMKKTAMLGMLFSGFLSFSALPGVSHGASAGYKFTIVDVPLEFTFLGQSREDIVRFTDINKKGEIVGNNFAGDGFLVNRKKKPIEIRCPGDQTDNHSTVVSGINNVGQIVGSCTDGAFVRERNGDITLLNFPGAEGTVASGINDLGHVVGQYWGTLFGQALQRFHGFIWKDGEYITIDAAFPNAMFTSLSGINNLGQIIGTYLHQRPGSSDPNDYDSELAFVYDNGSFTSLDFPGATAPFVCCGATTLPMDINNAGQILGSTYDGDGNLRFFLYDDGKYFVITGLPDDVADFGSAWGLNDRSEIAGTYIRRVPCERCGIGGAPGHTLDLHSFVAEPRRTHKKSK
jgi:hypothetical protein